MSASLDGVLADGELYREWLGPVQAALDGLTKGLSEEDGTYGEDGTYSGELNARAKKLLERIPELFREMATGRLEEHIAKAMAAGGANGIAARARKLGLTKGNTIPLSDTPSSSSSSPNPLLLSPSTFDAARRWLEQKAQVPTQLSSIAISNQWPEKFRNQAFFSARVASANVLQSLRHYTEKVASGELSYGEARKGITEFLAVEGYGIPEAGTGADKNIRDVASTSRMDLVLRQNVGMAHALGQRAVSEHPAVMERYPNYRYIAHTDRHAQFDGLVLPKTDPFWKTHYAPWDFGCQCIVVDEEGEPNAQTSGFDGEDDEGQSGRMDFAGHPLNVLPAESGFVFRSDPRQAFTAFDASAIDDPDLRRQFEAEMRVRRMEAA